LFEYSPHIFAIGSIFRLENFLHTSQNMSQNTKRFIQIAAMTLMAVFSSTSGAMATQATDIKARLLAEIAYQYAQIKETQRASKVLDQAIESIAAMSDQCFKANPLAKVAGGYFLVGEKDKSKQLFASAIQTAQTQTKTGCSSSATSPIESLLNRAKEYAAAGHIDWALQISTTAGDPLTLNEIAAQLFKAGKSQQATQILNQSIELAQRIDNPDYRTLLFINMSKRLSQIQARQEVVLLLEQALESNTAIGSTQGEDAITQSQQTLYIAKQFAAIGEKRRTLKILEQALPKIRTLTSQQFPLDKIIQLIDIALEYAALDQKNQAVAIMAQAHTAAQIIPPNVSKNREDALGKVAEGYAKLGNFEHALEIARSIVPIVERDVALQKIALVYVQTGNVEEGVKLAQSTSNSNYALTEIVRYYLTLDQPAQAWNLVQTKQVKGIASELALGYLKARQPQMALQIVQTGNLKGFTNEIVRSYVDVGQTNLALQLVREQPVVDEWMFPDIASGFAKEGQFDQALKVTQSINNKLYKAEALIAIAKVYASNGLAEQGVSQSILSAIANFFESLFGNSRHDKANEMLEKALGVTMSITSKDFP
jgi:tetratricopeptide (TPR) repeat protein